MEDNGYIEIETPVLIDHPSGATARPFVAHHNALDMDVYLRIAPETYLKRAIVGGFTKVFEFARCFRNEGMDTTHLQDFTMLEGYCAYYNYRDNMRFLQDMLQTVITKIRGSAVISINGTEIDFGAEWAVVTFRELILKDCGIDIDEFKTAEALLQEIESRHIELNSTDDPKKLGRGNLIDLLYKKVSRPKMIAPTFLIAHPTDLSPLARANDDDPEITDRFQLVINGAEIINAYSELVDPNEQRRRLQIQAQSHADGDEEAMVMDDDYLTAMEYGMPPTGGLGFGIDRCAMLLCGASSIRDVILFPTMKPLNGVRDGNGVSSEAVEAPKAEPEKIDFSKVEIEPLFKDFVDFETFSKSDFRQVKVLACEAVPKSKKLLKFTLDDGTGAERTILSGIHAYYEPEELVGKTCIAITNLPPRPMMGIDSCGMLISAVHHEEGEEKLHLLMVDDHIPAGAKLY